MSRAQPCWELKNKPPKFDESSIFAPKGAPFIFGQVLKKIKAIERILRKIFTKNMMGGQNLPPVSSARVKEESLCFLAWVAY